MKKTLVIILFFCNIMIWAENDIRISILFTHNSIGYPIANNIFEGDLNPGFIIGLEYDYYKSENFDLSGSIFVSGSFHSNSFFGNLFSVGSELIPRFHFRNGVYFDTIIGVSYTHIFSTIPTYTLSNSSLGKSIDWGRPNLSINIGLGAGYDFDIKLDFPLKLFIRYDFNLVSSFSADLYSNAILPTQSVLIGTSYSFNL